VLLITQLLILTITTAKTMVVVMNKETRKHYSCALATT